MAMEKIEIGKIIIFGPKEYILGPTSTQAFNAWVDIVNQGFPKEKYLGKIHLWKKDGKESILLTHQEIAEYLRK